MTEEQTIYATSIADTYVLHMQDRITGQMKIQVVGGNSRWETTFNHVLGALLTKDMQPAAAIEEAVQITDDAMAAMHQHMCDMMPTPPPQEKSPIVKMGIS